MIGNILTIKTIYITAPDRDTALGLARALVGERLVACANVLDGVVSVYRWEGRVCEDSEAVLIAKTRTELTQRVIERVRELHPYDCPCVAVLPVESGNPAYFDWVLAETASAE